MIYIGKSASDDPYYLGSGSSFKKALRQYGRKSFKKEILLDNILCSEELGRLEEFYIKLYNSNNPEVGYNIKIKGSRRQTRHTPEAIEKIRTRSNQEDNKLLIRRIQKISSKSRIGTHFSKESKLRMVKTKFKKSRKIEIFNVEGILQNTCDFVYEANDITKVSKSAIRNNLCGLSNKTRSHIFKYKEI